MVLFIMIRDSDGFENLIDVEMFDIDVLEEDLESVSGSDEEFESEIIGVGRVLGDDDDGSEDEEDEEEDEDEDSEDDDESDSGFDLVRGKGNIEISFEDEDDMVDLFLEEFGFEYVWRELDKDVFCVDEIICWLVVCNMDWDRLKVKDLLVLFNLFKFKGGVIFFIKIYFLEFGKERMKEE